MAPQQILVQIAASCAIGSALVLAPRSRPSRLRLGWAPRDAGAQWADFAEHHARGLWYGARTTYDASGRIVGDESVAITRLQLDAAGARCAHALKVPTTEVASDKEAKCQNAR